MVNHECLEIIRSFTDKDKIEFSKFVNSPYFNTSKPIIRLWEEISKFHPTYDGLNFTDKIFSDLLNVKETTIRRYFANLLPLCEKYIGLAYEEKFDDEFRLIVIRELFHRKAEKAFNKKILKYENELKRRKNAYTGDFNTLFKLENMKHDNDIFNVTVKNKTKFEDLTTRLFVMHKYLFFYYFLNALIAYIQTVEHSLMISKDPKKTKLGIFFEMFFHNSDIMKLKEKKIFGSKSIFFEFIELYWLYLQIVLQEDVENNFRKYKEILFKIEDKLHIDEKFNFYMICTKLHRYADQNPSFRKIEIDFYNRIFENKAYKTIATEIMPLRLFRYFCIRGDIVGQYEWTEKIIKKYIGLIDGALHDSVKALRESFVQFKRFGNYTKALEFLERVKDHGELQIKRDVKHYETMIYYEMGRDKKECMNFHTNHGKL